MLLDIFEPYMLFITFFITIIVNIMLIKSKLPWYSLIIANVILTLIMNFLGLGEYDFISVVVVEIVEVLRDIIVALIDSFIEFWTSIIKSIGDALNPFK